MPLPDRFCSSVFVMQCVALPPQAGSMSALRLQEKAGSAGVKQNAFQPS